MAQGFKVVLFVVACILGVIVIASVAVAGLRLAQRPVMLKKPLSFSNTKCAFALLTQVPNWKWLDFLQTFASKYNVHIFVDNNDIDLVEERAMFPNFMFIQLSNKETAAAGYQNSSYVIKSGPIAWDKALYYFNRISLEKQPVWFCEDDVYIRSVGQLRAMDGSHPTADLLCERNTCVQEASSKWHYPQVWGKVNLPWCGSMVCLCRLSPRLLSRVDGYVRKHGQLDFIEVLFPTLAVGMEVVTPAALSTITYKDVWNKELVESDHIYHPFKNIDDHVYMRST